MDNKSVDQFNEKWQTLNQMISNLGSIPTKRELLVEIENILKTTGLDPETQMFRETMEKIEKVVNGEMLIGAAFEKGKIPQSLYEAKEKMNSATSN